MIGYVTVGTNDMARAGAFYDAILGELGARRVMDNEQHIMWSAGRGKPLLMLSKPFDGKPATVGNGVMVAFAAASREQVDALHARALALGSADEGKPGLRGDSFYGAYCRDLDGNKLCFFIM